MEILESNSWWIMAGILVIIELMSGTFYLLMLALGAAAGGLATAFGLGLEGQIVIGALCAGGTTGTWHWYRMKHPRSKPAQQNPDVNLDVGQEVWVPAWGNDGYARITYRGTEWSARLASGCLPESGKHTIFSLEGNTLVLKPAKSLTD